MDTLPMRVVVTGGATSVGLAVAKRLNANGNRIAICDLNAGAISQVVGENPSFIGSSVDVTMPDEVEAFFSQVTKEMGGVDVIVNTVGLGGPQAFIEDVTYEDWDLTMRGSVGASFLCIKQVVGGMKERKFGSIVNFSSTSTRTGLPRRTPYVAAKWALEGMTRNLARELGPYNIRVNAILPGAIDNDRMRMIVARAAAEKSMTAEEYEASLLEFVSMRSKISVDEIADLVAYLVSPSSRHLTGQLIALDGNIEWEG